MPAQESMRQQLRVAVAAAQRRAVEAGDLDVDAQALPDVTIERPARPEHGDFASNAAMRLAPLARADPMDIAGRLTRHLELPAGVLDTSVARPGFINFTLDPVWVADQVRAILDAGPAYGRVHARAGRVDANADRDAGRTQRINVEFISANPTGPLHVGNGRGAFVGDALASVLEATGNDVTREYYVNDYGSQIRDFGESVYLARTGQSGEAGYKGAYIGELAAEIPSKVLSAPNPLERIGEYAWNRVLEDIRRTVERLRIHIDVWKAESELHRAGLVAESLRLLGDAGHTYEADGALWFRATAFGDDKDRVLVRSNGEPTYFAADVAYLLDKLGRGFDRLVYILGPDHHGDVARLKGAAAALGHDPAAVEIIIYQHVRLVRDGDEVSMSKRAGTFVTLDELVDEVGADATRFFFTARSATQHLDFDLELAKRQSNENPVYYVQYAHARCSSILRQALARGVSVDAHGLSADDRDAALLTHPAEQTLIKSLLELPEVIAEAAARRETHELPRYCQDLASHFSQFYRDCQVLSDDAALTGARLRVVHATRQVLANALELLAIGAPDQM
ncbi:MAG: arginine--tRNA ligase [Candidatus Limnocylindria bacterium]